jgi:hypothetical protein
MPHVTADSAPPDQKTLDIEIAHLRDLDIGMLQARWQTIFGRKSPSHLPRHLLLRLLAYRLQADCFGDLDSKSRQLLDGAATPEAAGKRIAEKNQIAGKLSPGTVLSRELNGRIHRVTVLANGFAWNGKTYPSLSKIAFAITGTRWNGPRFFGLRDKAAKTRS